MDTITSFQGKNSFLSNFFVCDVVVDGITYPTAEHAFQAAKTTDPEEQEWIRSAPKPGSAKWRGKRVQLRSDWEDIKLSVMATVLRAKFEHPELRALLLATDGAELQEGNIWNDTFWGVSLKKPNHPGQNHLGRLLMELRAELA